MKKIGLHGSYFCRNFGDTLILAIINNWIREYSPDSQVTLPYVESAQEAMEILGKPSEKNNIKDLDCFIFGPGGYFGEPPVSYLRRLQWTHRNYLRHIKWNSALYKNNIPYLIIGVGVGPLTNILLRKRVVKLFQNAKYISVRDKYSKEYLIKWGIDESRINVSSDVALTLQPNSEIVKNLKPKVALHFPGRELYQTNTVKEFIQFIEYLSPNYDIYLLEDSKNQFSDSKSKNIRRTLLENNMDLPIIKYKSPNSLVKELEEFDKIITSKLHVGIVGYALGKKVLSIPRHSKNFRFYEQIQRENFCIPFEELSTQKLKETFESLKEIDNSKNVLYEDAINNKELVFKFLNSL